MLMKSARVVLAENLAHLMAQSADLRSSRQLSKRSRVAQTTISNWLRVAEMPALAPQLSALEAVARVFGITVGELLTERGQDGDRDEIVRLRAELAAARSQAVRASQQLYELAAALGGCEDDSAPKRRPFVDPAVAASEDYLLSGVPFKRGK